MSPAASPLGLVLLLLSLSGYASIMAGADSVLCYYCEPWRQENLTCLDYRTDAGVINCSTGKCARIVVIGRVAFMVCHPDPGYPVGCDWELEGGVDFFTYVCDEDFCNGINPEVEGEDGDELEASQALTEAEAAEVAGPNDAAAAAFSLLSTFAAAAISLSTTIL